MYLVNSLCLAPQREHRGSKVGLDAGGLGKPFPERGGGGGGGEGVLVTAVMLCLSLQSVHRLRKKDHFLGTLMLVMLDFDARIGFEVVFVP